MELPPPDRSQTSLEPPQAILPPCENFWLLKHQHQALLAPPLRSELAERAQTNKQADSKVLPPPETSFIDEWFHSSGADPLLAIQSHRRTLIRRLPAGRMARWGLSGALLLVAVVLTVVNAQITNYFTSTDLSNLQKKADGVLGSPKSLQGAYYATQALKSTGRTSLSCNCHGLQDLLSAASTAYELYYANRLDSECKCDLKYPTDASALARKDMSVRNRL